MLIAAASWPLVVSWANAVRAQSKQPVLVGWLHSGPRKANGQYLAVLKEAMAALGWKEGAQFVVEERWADGQPDRLPGLASELAARKPALIVAAPTTAAAAAAKAAPRTPVVHVFGDMVATGLVTSLARPDGMITGVTNLSTNVSEKFLELLLDAVPGLQRVGFLFDSGAITGPFHMESARRAIARHRIEASLAEAGHPEEIEPALARLAKERVQALIVPPSQTFLSERQRIVVIAQGHRWPVIAGARPFVEEGGLLSYGIDVAENYRRAATFVDKILRGAKPGDLPVEQPTRFELVVNLKTAKMLGLKISRDFLARADEVIQ